MVFLDIRKQRNTAIVLKYLLENSESQVKDVSEGAGIPFSACDRKLKELVKEGLVISKKLPPEKRNVGKPPKIYAPDIDGISNLFAKYNAGVPGIIPDLAYFFSMIQYGDLKDLDSAFTELAVANLFKQPIEKWKLSNDIESLRVSEIAALRVAAERALEQRR